MAFLDVLAAKYASVTVSVTWWSLPFSLAAVILSAAKLWLSSTNFLASSCLSIAVDGLMVADVLIMPGASWMAALSAATDESSADTNGFFAAWVLMLAVSVATNWSTVTCELVVPVYVATNRSTAACDLMLKDMSLTFTVFCLSMATAVLLMLMGSVASSFLHLP